MIPKSVSLKIEAVFPGLSLDIAAVLTQRLARFYDRLEKSESRVDEAILGSDDFLKVMLYSEFIASQVSTHPQFLEQMGQSRDLIRSYSSHTFETKLDPLIPKDADLGSVKEGLIRFKTYEAVRIAWRDLAGIASLEETMAELSHLACACLSYGINRLYPLFCDRWGTPTDANGNFQQLIVLGMGKLGAGELNFSSDIDLIFAYPEQGYTTGESSISNDEFFTKLCREFLKLFAMGSGTHFYRVDTRLRPFGENGPLVMNSAAFEQYYQSQGREWERYAMIKARPVAGDIESGNELLNILKPFIYRRYFDYGSFDSFREMKQRISLQVKSAKLKDNIKLGAGGIREVEFFGQLFQLIRGGVEPDLQVRPILRVLDLLLDFSCINEKTCEQLKHAYCFLRKVENRLQEYQDRQVHDIPQDPLQREILALSMGFESHADFFQVLSKVLDNVHGHFSQLLVGGDQEDKESKTHDLEQIWTNLNDPQFITETIAVSGFRDPDQVLSMLRILADHPNTQRLTPVGRKKLARLVPRLVKEAGRTSEAETVLNKLIDLIITIERRTCYLSLLIENKGALSTLIVLARKSPWIISFLSQHPVLLDELMHPATLYAPPKRTALEKEMETRMARTPRGDLEFLLEELNIFRQVNTLRVAAADVSGNYPLMKVSDHLTYIAETILTQVLESSWEIVTSKYGQPQGLSGSEIKGCGFAIAAYGKVGGLEMGYKSDLDLVFLYQADPGQTLGGERSIDTVRFYSNLGQRIIHALTMHTSAGTLYGADMRLRPGGDSGMIVSHMESFEDYLENQAWTWEHQALIRARCVAGDPALFERFDRIREKVLSKDRDPEILKTEVREMREKMRKQRLVPEPGRFDLKQVRGGIVDIEFLVQFLVLCHGARFPDVLVWTDNIRLMEGLSVEGLISGEESQILQETYVAMRQSMHRLTLQEKPQTVAEAILIEKADAVAGIYDDYLGRDE
ncbi:MAG: bifunctional [glutamate--ammonia ligase]-adenylyl-L-tyrosine phosphorylase/[glutamate--ammonia-ligase] adenylyltransferase [Desulfobacter sp.]|nr:bifunctional [glutamate--ammonia ligase]-adenylyl-L-tyrosine phosphorylase/[glutamate--ammonia-ligase] adenylyltransferase [Desulfobacter sp.]WDP84304.1 MAG: bifunctional [glutamate--ammonia ligase]-adenylyl-L-tyrosine phosphorylase/[glutamate--ammonia-ligase] adenylyltransferase [Desulfobacter sp.]